VLAVVEEARTRGFAALDFPGVPLSRHSKLTPGITDAALPTGVVFHPLPASPHSQHHLQLLRPRLASQPALRPGGGAVRGVGAAVAACAYGTLLVLMGWLD